MTTVGIGKQYDMYASIVPVHAAASFRAVSRATASRPAARCRSEEGKEKLAVAGVRGRVLVERRDRQACLDRYGGRRHHGGGEGGVVAQGGVDVVVARQDVIALEFVAARHRAARSELSKQWVRIGRESRAPVVERPREVRALRLAGAEAPRIHVPARIPHAERYWSSTRWWWIRLASCTGFSIAPRYPLDFMPLVASPKFAKSWLLMRPQSLVVQSS